MIKLFTLILSLSVLQIGLAQKVRFTDTSNTWKVSASGKDYMGIPFTASYHYYYDGDTTIKPYKRIYSYSIRHSGASSYPRADVYLIREDTLSGRIWSRMIATGTNNTDTSEKLIYNPNWALNDTLFGKPGVSPLYYINHIDSTQINGVWHRVFGVRDVPAPQTQDYYHVIEGLGSDIGPGYSFTGGVGLERGYRLMCFYNQGSKPALNPKLSQAKYVGSFSNTTPCDLKVWEPGEDGAASLYPNPVTSASKIELRKPIENGALRIYDGMGSVLAEKQIVHSSSVTLPALNYSGVYYYSISDLQSGALISGTFTGK